MDSIVNNCGAVTGREVWSSIQALCSCATSTNTASATPAQSPAGSPSGTVIPPGPGTPTGAETPTNTEAPTGAETPTNTATPTNNETPANSQTSTDTGTPTNTTPSPAPTQHCHGSYHYWWVAYSIQIGIPYIGSADCDATYHALESATTSVTGWQCVKASDGTIQLWFNCFPDDAADINRVLESRYPTIAGGFNCPNE